jgi:hypothetical protein
VRPAPVTLLLTTLAAVLLSAAPAQAKECSGTYRVKAPGATLIGDRIVAKDISCASAQRLVRRFLRAQARDIGCAGRASTPGKVCYLRPYDCEKRGPRASCLEDGFYLGPGVTFRQRDRSTG